MKPWFSFDSLLARWTRVAIAVSAVTVFAVPDVSAGQIRCNNAGVTVYEGQAGVVSTLCFSYMPSNAGGLSVAPDQFIITNILRLGDKSDTINETADQLSANFTFPGSSHPGFVEPPASLVEFADTSFRLNLGFTTPPAHRGGIVDSGTTVITGFVTWEQIGGGILSGASEAFSLTVVVRDVPEPQTASLILIGALSLSLVSLHSRYRQRAKRSPAPIAKR